MVESHLKVYCLIARLQYGCMVQILAGPIAYLLIAIYCHSNFNKKARELGAKIKNEDGYFNFDALTQNNFILKNGEKIMTKQKPNRTMLVSNIAMNFIFA